jgi:1-acyl-sn-glycerol-3-phosphate acyltransferase
MSVLKRFAQYVFKVQGWSYENQIGPFGPKCILIAAPHTSNWDYSHGLVFFDKMGIPAKIAMKRELFVFPIRQFIEPLGAIAIDRKKDDEGKKESAVQSMANLFNEHDELILVITPEGTRSKTSHWRTGFYHVARLANVPIVLSHLDYEARKGIVGKIIYPTGNLEADMAEIMEYYKTRGKGKYRENFSLDERYIK